MHDFNIWQLTNAAAVLFRDVIYLLAPVSKDEEKTLTRRYQGLPFLKSEANKHIFLGSSNIYKIEAMWTANNNFAGWEILGLGSSTGYP